MNAIRRAVLNDEMDTAPVDLGTWTEQERPSMEPPFRGHRGSWSPHLDSPALWRYEEPGMEEEITRYPAVLDTEECFHESENDNWPDESEVDTDIKGGEWFHGLGGVHGERYYD